MKKTLLNMLLGLVAVIGLTACGGSGGDTPDNPVDNQVFPTCTLTQELPLVVDKITVHAVCTGGNVNIDEATVTVDGQVETLNFTGSSLDDYVTFTDLQDDTTYEVVFEAIIDGKMFTESVDMQTKDIPFVDTEAPVITVTGGTTSMYVGGTYVPPTVTAMDDVDGDISSEVVNTGDTVNPNLAGTYVERYNVADSSGNQAEEKTHTVTVTVAPPPISHPTISIVDKTVYDEGGAHSNPVGTPTVTGVVAGAVYSLSSNPFGAMLTIDSTTGAMTWNGDLFSDTTNTVGVKVTNPDGGNATAIFSLTVLDNG